MIERTRTRAGVIAALSALACSLSHGQMWQVFDMANAGFGSNTITDIAVDSQGIVWVGTNWGLNRYDGTTWTNFLTGNSGLPDNAINSLAIDSLDRVWMGTVFHGVVVFDGSTWTQYDPLNSGIPDYEVKCVTIDHRGWLWVGTYLGLACYDGVDWRLYNDTPGSYGGLVLNSNVIEDVAVRADGLVAIGTLNGGFHYLTDTVVVVHATYIDFFPDNTQMGVVFDTIHDERWLATPSQGLLRHGGSWSNGPWFQYSAGTSGIPTDGLSCIVMDDTGLPWMGSTIAGVIRRNSDGTFDAFNEGNSGLPDNTVECLAFETDGALWAGTFYGGAGRLDLATATASLHAPAFTLFPNPVADRLSIAGLGLGLYEWELLDLSGRKVQGGRVESDGSVASTVIDVPGGSYLFRVSDGRRAAVKPLVKL